MLRRLFRLSGPITALQYAVLAPTLLFSQHLIVAMLFSLADAALLADTMFWLLPLRRLIELPVMSPWISALTFAFSLIVAWGLAVLSYRRAGQSGIGFALAALSIIPGVQLVAVAGLLGVPMHSLRTAPLPSGVNMAHALQGVLAGMAIIVFAVLLSAVTLGSYGWGLFVATPFFVGLTTAYLANRDVALPPGKTFPLVLLAAALGVLALLMFALEGFICIILIVPLGALVAAVGGALGQKLADVGHQRGRPLLSVAILPLVFLAEAAMPPAVMITTHESIDIAASPSTIWRALISDAPIAGNTQLVALAGFAYPVRGRLLGQGVGAVRLGEFSTGTARERVTSWQPGKRLAFVVIHQPAMMEEMSPYRRVHAPHLNGYFETDTTSFELRSLPTGKTRLLARATHRLRIDPALYWEPLARWAIKTNVTRVLESIKGAAEAPSGQDRD
jgi:hypothetical protein